MTLLDPSALMTLLFDAARCRCGGAAALALVAGLSATAGLAVGANEQGPRDAVLSRADTVKRVKQDLARRLKVTPDALELIAESDETWKDANLGCAGTKPLGEPAPTPGFAFILSHDGRRYVYHSDRHGHLRRCDEPMKPIDPITR